MLPLAPQSPIWSPFSLLVLRIQFLKISWFFNMQDLHVAKIQPTLTIACHFCCLEPGFVKLGPDIIMNKKDPLVNFEDHGWDCQGLTWHLEEKTAKITFLGEKFVVFD